MISTASPGDTVFVPAGSCTWDTTLSITKGIILIGAGAANTVITGGANTNPIISYTPTDKSANLPFRISGFTFDLAGQQRTIGGLFLSSGNTLILQTKLRIDHNRFQNVGSPGNYMWIGGLRGVVDQNYFDTCTDYPVRFTTDPTGDAGLSIWNNHEGIVFGKPDNNIWFEDNTFNLVGGGLTDTVFAARYGFRYNLINISTQPNPMFDLHGNFMHTGPPSYPFYSGMGVELYGNTTVGGPGGRFFDQRGGRAYVFLNSFGPSTSWFISVRDESLASNEPVGPYVGPNPPQYSQDINGTYAWGNRPNLTGDLVIIYNSTNGGLGETYMTPVVGTDFFSDSSSPGITMGTLANLPATCTVGQGYWATAQSITDLTGMVGPNPATPISGSLYICYSANAWTSLGSPLAYPHPLRVAPAAPTNPQAH
jgi:hypothetical protein